MTADSLLKLVMPLGVTSMSIGDVGDVSTWKFDGKSFDRAAVIATVQAALAAEVNGAPVDPLVQIRADIGRLRTDVDALQAGVK